jgi:DNA-binding transcriptional MocR family regulator
LLAALRRQFVAPLIWGQHAGLHLTWFPSPELGSAAELVTIARLCGLEAAAADGRARSPGSRAVLLGFGMQPERQFEPLVARFAAMLQAGASAIAGSAG